MCNTALVAGAGNNIAWNCNYWWQHWSFAGNENIPPQNLASKIQIWRASDIDAVTIAVCRAGGTFIVRKYSGGL